MEPTSHHLTERQIEAYHQRVLRPLELLEVDDHLAACAECRLRMAAGAPLAGALAAWEKAPEEPRWRSPFLWAAAAVLVLACGLFSFRLVKPDGPGPSSQTVLRGPVAAPPFTLQAPLDAVAPGGRPTFRWTPLAGARSYRVMVFDPDFNPRADSGPLTRTDWTPDRPLPEGTYTWQVRARRGGEEVTAPGPGQPQALFRVTAPDPGAQSPSPTSTNPAQ